jgi:hypothetical protein
MNSDDDLASGPPGLLYRLLEQLASAVLLLVLAALGWMIVAASFPESGRLASLEGEVLGVVGLLLAALLLVSLVALLHTRKRQRD